jgi:acid phosphatase
MAPPSPSVTVERVVIAVLVGIIAFLWSPRSALYEGSEPVCPTTGTGSQQLGGLKDNCAAKPHHASWNSWWHPQRRSSNSSGESAGTRTEDWNILYHLGGNGPWVEKVDNVVDGGLAPPDRCVVEQVHMVCFVLRCMVVIIVIAFFRCQDMQSDIPL